VTRRGPFARPGRAAALIVLLAVGSASCVAPSASPRGASATESPRLDVAKLDPCFVLDRETVAAELLGEVSLGTAEEDAATGTAACRYTLLSGLAAISIVIDRAPVSGVGGEAVLESLGPLPGLEELHGVGDVAWFGYCPACPIAATTTLTVIAAPLEFSIAFEGAAPPVAERLHAEELARGIVEDLGL
jgi:hypothetical protein